MSQLSKLCSRLFLLQLWAVVVASSTWLSLEDDDRDDEVDETVERDCCERLCSFVHLSITRAATTDAAALLLLSLAVLHEQVHEKCPYGDEIAIGWMKCVAGAVVAVAEVVVVDGDTCDLCGLFVGDTDALEQVLAADDEESVSASWPK